MRKKPLFIAILLLSFLPLFCSQAIEITNPLQWDTFEELINAIIDGLWTISLVLVPIMIIIAGYFFVTSAGEPDKINNAKKMVLYTMIGFLIITMAKGMIVFLKEVLGVQLP